MRLACLLAASVTSAVAVNYYPVDVSKIWQYKIVSTTHFTTSPFAPDTTYLNANDSLFQIWFDYLPNYANDSTYVITYSYLLKDGSTDTIDQDPEMVYHGRIHDVDIPGIPEEYRYRVMNPMELTHEDSTEIGTDFPAFAGTITVPYGTFENCWNVPKAYHSYYYADGIGMIRSETYISSENRTIVRNELQSIIDRQTQGVMDHGRRGKPELTISPVVRMNAQFVLLNTSSSADVEFYNLSGRLMAAYANSAPGSQMKIPAVADGPYFIRVRTKDETFSAKAIIAR